MLQARGAASKIVRDVHDTAGKHMKPVFRRYPLTFLFLLTFSVVAILHGFEIWADQVTFFDRHPFALIGIGVVALLLTGTLYKTLDKAH